MKRLLIILDGMGDEAIPELGGKTPAEYARMPGLDYMRKHGTTSCCRPVPAGCEPSTDAALLHVLGYEVTPGLAARSWLEALGAGIPAGGNDLCLRCSLISHSKGKLTSHCGGDVGPRQCEEIIARLNRQFGSEKLTFHSCGSFRNIALVHDCGARVTARPPHELLGRPVSELAVRSDDPALEGLLNRCIAGARPLLSRYPANGIALWAPGRPLRLAPKIKGAAVAGVNVVKGIARAAGLSVVVPAGATGDAHTDYRAKAEAALQALERESFVLLHVEAPDEASHQRDSLQKAGILEEIDRCILRPLLQRGKDLQITLRADHATSSRSGKHLSDPVEVITFHNTISLA